MMSFRYLENIALAEAAFEAEGKDLRKLFTSCAEAFIDTSVDPSSVKPVIKKHIEIKGKNVEDLLFNFLNELVFLKDSESFIPKKVEISEISDNFLKAVVVGDLIKVNEGQSFRADIKAITMHKFKVEKTDKGWKAVVVMDI